MDLGFLDRLDWGGFQVLADAVLVVLLTAAIGWERERRHRPAGLRTHILVGLSTWLLVTLGEILTRRYDANPSVRLDPIRILQAIVGGISFIGAGTIFVSGREERVKGITTAAGLLAVTAISAAVALDASLLAIAFTLVVLFVLGVLRYFER